VTKRETRNKLTWSDARERFWAEGLVKAANPTRNPEIVGHIGPPAEEMKTGIKVNVKERKK
jgi:hypothetical protein